MHRVYAVFMVVVLFLFCTKEEIGIPDLVYPINGEQAPLPITFIWSSVNSGFAYRIQVDTTLTFSAPIVLADGNDTTYTVDSFDCRTYYWRVAAFDEDNKLGEFSYPHSFETIDTISPIITAVIGTLALQPGISGDINNSRVAIYLSYDDWLNDNVYMSAFAIGSGTTASYAITDVDSGNYFLDAWKDVNNNGLFDTGDLFGWYGTGVYPNVILTQFHVSIGQTFTADVEMMVLP